MNKPIRTLSLFCGLLFLVLLGNATYLQYFRADSLDKSSLNRRVIEASFARERGAILVDGEPVARSVKSDDRYKWQRRYPAGALYAHETGWFSYFSQSGIEHAENSVLSGDDPRLFGARLADLIGSGQPKGGSVELTLNPAAQKAAYDGLQALGTGIQGSVVALEPATGRILAMVSLPSYDPNRLASHDLSKVSAADKQLEGDPAQPKLNRAIRTTLPPGSTFKLVTAAAAIENGLYDEDSQVPAGAGYKLPESTSIVHNSTGSACNPATITLKYALEWSCNTAFAAIADKLGNAKMKKMAENFGFNDTSLQDLTGQVRSRYPSMNRPQTALSGFGQADVAATPLQMAMVAAGIANHGVLMRPHLVDELRSPDFDSLGKTDSEVYKRAISSAVARQLTDMMVGVVEEGTANTAAIPGIRVAGKTGTAQTGRSDISNYAWFTSFAPADDPQVAVAVMIQNSQRSNGEISGGGLAGPIAKAVMEAVINK
ncbi:peptidoglycan D,D-transpeptidase FtsI family protein [Nocardioides jiangxiensis]|uniref:Penicillin-binding protein 2 n=1 Tax=Nocardioides jiangxiensis TaxID=3064524 RepID=A0ABT9B3W1_9ACTN|nr:penicillin-binding protein 2 [Nocardioides sp. WY-20]MDO7868277.1 penicillin-binding protein 2 [Nocardioides sp. WY-20]